MRRANISNTHAVQPEGPNDTFCSFPGSLDLVPQQIMPHVNFGTQEWTHRPQTNAAACISPTVPKQTPHYYNGGDTAVGYTYDEVQAPVSSTHHALVTPPGPPGSSESTRMLCSDQQFPYLADVQNPYYTTIVPIDIQNWNLYFTSDSGNQQWHDGTVPAPSNPGVSRTDLLVPHRPQVGSQAMTLAALSNRKKKPIHFCQIRGCTSRGFTTKQSFECV
ncbi:hypothetical protein L218DRAFT_1050456 [Marasmius fiardii PR-910]|nr:hypothetical protein L218DRAFT_1050456 [Marasmius fiardii PR-910]